MVAATVVAAVKPWLTAMPRSRRLALNTPSLCASVSSSAVLRPIVGLPCQTAIVAGTAPSSRITASAAVAVCQLSGHGIPWAITVDSRATTGRPLSTARATSDRTSRWERISIGHPRWRHEACSPKASGQTLLLLEFRQGLQGGLAHRFVLVAGGFLQGLDHRLVAGSDNAERLGRQPPDLGVLFAQALDENGNDGQVVGLA